MIGHQQHIGFCLNLTSAQLCALLRENRLNNENKLTSSSPSQAPKSTYYVECSFLLFQIEMCYLNTLLYTIVVLNNQC